MEQVSYCKPRRSLFQQFHQVKDSFVFYVNVEDLLIELDIASYNASEWRLLIESSKRSLKFGLFHNGNIYGSISIAYSAHAKESYEEVCSI